MYLVNEDSFDFAVKALFKKTVSNINFICNPALIHMIKCRKAQPSKNPYTWQSNAVYISSSTPAVL